MSINKYNPSSIYQNIHHNVYHMSHILYQKLNVHAHVLKNALSYTKMITESIPKTMEYITTSQPSPLMILKSLIYTLLISSIIFLITSTILSPICGLLKG